SCILLGFVLLIVMAAVVLLIEHLRGKLAYNRRVAELTHKGEQLSVPALQPPRPPAAQNSAPLLWELTNASSAPATDWDTPPPSPRFPAPGKALIVWQLAEWSRDGKQTNN